MKFDPTTLAVMKQHCQSPSSGDQTSTTKSGVQSSNCSLFGFYHGSSSMAEWLQKVKHLKTTLKTQPLGDKQERMSVISGDERDWDLISICVSDEGARHEDPTTVTPTP
uniref:Uncharacterized protein n=1 Tax=Cuerna arida TaxID=1464854 RepID=A0A1B6FJQ6_9HEMI